MHAVATFYSYVLRMLQLRFTHVIAAFSFFSGGFFALFDGRINDLLLQGDSTKNRDFKIWTDAASDPLE